MCANFAVKTTIKNLVYTFEVSRELMAERDHRNTHQVFPGWHAPIIFSLENDRAIQSAYWSLIPFNNKDPRFGVKYKTFNAVSETVESKRTFQEPWAKGQRCIIPVTHFVEWRGQAGAKEKLAIRPKDTDLFCIAGLYETNPFNTFTFTMLTCTPNEQMKTLHHRMPVILKDWREWLDPSTTPDKAKLLCQPYGERLEARRMKENE